ncbi:hypothetical protein CASFOL_035359 [Castilleja foliolosa]|uniref:Uncharacterized protein n=1 Tax=Castilleja foliolosa TaxID=1961234 RepID=A0ABD3BUQ9_9LAMI
MLCISNLNDARGAIALYIESEVTGKLGLFFFFDLPIKATRGQADCTSGATTSLDCHRRDHLEEMDGGVEYDERGGEISVCARLHDSEPEGLETSIVKNRGGSRPAHRLIHDLVS